MLVSPFIKCASHTGVAATDIMAITGHKNQQSLTDYGELDDADHHRIGEILSSTSSLSGEVQPLPQNAALTGSLTCF